MQWKARLRSRAWKRALGIAIGPPGALIAFRRCARGWSPADEPAEEALGPERWGELRELAERAALMPKGRIDLAAIRRWHAERGFLGAITLREWPGEERYSRLTGVSDRERHECYYIYYELTGRGERLQQIFVRGTCVPEDFVFNILVAKDWDEELGCHLHHGFRVRADEVLESLEPLLDREATITLSGHSLGGAVATIVGMRLQARGYNVSEVVTFGAPKVTDKAGARGHGFRARVLRVSNLLDPVPLLPFGFCTPWSGPFSQLGAEVLLLPPRPKAFAYLAPEAAAPPWVASFLLHCPPLRRRREGCPGWLDMHRMWSYLRLLEPLAAEPHDAQRIPFSQRHLQSYGESGGTAATTSTPRFACLWRGSLGL